MQGPSAPFRPRDGRPMLRVPRSGPAPPTMPFRSLLPLALVLFARAARADAPPDDTPAWSAHTYANVDLFLRAVEDVMPARTSGVYGALTGLGRRDWVGDVYFRGEGDPAPWHQLVILVQQADGRYRPAAWSRVMSAEGGTGHHYIAGVEIRNDSLYVMNDWNWHGCGGTARHQYKLYKGDWRLIGVTFTRTNAVPKGTDEFEPTDSMTFDRNVLTGDVIVDYRPRDGKPVRTRKRGTPEKLLFHDYEEQQGWVAEFDGYPDCP